MEDKEGRHPAADLRGISMPYIQGDVRLGGLSSFDGNERWTIAGMMRMLMVIISMLVMTVQSLRDYTVCTLDDCG